MEGVSYQVVDMSTETKSGKPTIYRQQAVFTSLYDNTKKNTYKLNYKVRWECLEFQKDCFFSNGFFCFRQA